MYRTETFTSPAPFLAVRFSWPLLIGVAIFAFLIQQPRLLRDPDTCWHLQGWRMDSRHGAIPQVDHFSHTMKGAPWHPHEWFGGEDCCLPSPTRRKYQMVPHRDMCQCRFRHCASASVAIPFAFCRTHLCWVRLRSHMPCSPPPCAAARPDDAVAGGVEHRAHECS